MSEHTLKLFPPFFNNKITMSSKSNWKISEFVAHSSSVLCSCLSPSDGRTLATGGEDKRVNLWLVGQPHNITSISGLSSPIATVTFNSTENWLGAGSRSGSLKVFDLNENKVARSISGHKASITCLDFHRYGDILASGSLDTNIKLWDVRRKGCIYTYKEHSESINSLQFSPDGKWLISASNDNTVKLWDLNAAKCLKEFSVHTAPVNDVQFHPKEFLLAAASADRTVSFWDLEDFSLVSSSSPEGHPVRKILFHSEGHVIFSASQDSLRVLSWEPSLQLDYLPIPWGKVDSIQLSGDQIIGSSYSGTNVSLWCVDIKRLKPWSNSNNSNNSNNSDVTTTSSTAATGGQRGYQSARQQFQYREEEMERPPTHPSGLPPAEKNRVVGVVEGEESPPTEVKSEDRVLLFKEREQLVRTPPKQLHLAPFQPPPVPLPFTPVDHTHHSNEPSIHQLVTKPHPPNNYSAKEIIRDINAAHTDVCSILRNRQTLLQEVRAEWSMNEPKGSLEVAINCGNQSVIVDLLSVLNLKRSLWSLDMAALVLAEVRLLLKSKHERYIRCACATLKLILKSFASVIITNIRQPATPTSVIDLAREERLERCQLCHSHLSQIRGDLSSSSLSSSLLSKILREENIMETFTLLD